MFLVVVRSQAPECIIRHLPQYGLRSSPDISVPGLEEVSQCSNNELLLVIGHGDDIVDYFGVGFLPQIHLWRARM